MPFIAFQVVIWADDDNVMVSVDATFIDPSDLEVNMGYMGQFWHPEVVKVMDRVLEACMDSKVAPGIAFGKFPAHCGELIE